MSGWFNFFGGDPIDKGAEDCDQCLSEPDWHRMGMTPRHRHKNLARVDPRRFLDQLVYLREQYGELEDEDQRTDETLETFAVRKKGKKRTATAYIDGEPIGGVSEFFITFDHTPLTWTYKPSEGDDDR